MGTIRTFSLPLATIFCLLLMAGAVPAQDRPAGLNGLIAEWDQWVEASPQERPAPEVALDLARRIVDHGRELIREDRRERALAVYRILNADESIALLQERNPPGLDSFLDELRTATGEAYFRRAEQFAARGNREAAEQHYRIAALEYFRPGEDGYAHSWYRIGLMYDMQGRHLLDAGNETEAVANFNAAAASYMQVVENPPSDPQLLARANRAIEGLLDFGFRLEVPGMPTPEPEPEPGEVAGFFQRIVGEDVWASVVDFGQRLLQDRNLQETILWWVAAIAVFVAVYWVVPRWALNRAGRGGSFSATTWLPWVRLLGIFALLGWMIASAWEYVRYRQQKAALPPRPRCVKCRTPLDDPHAYEDFVFSRCPKCKAPVQPIYSVEHVVKSLAEGLAAEAEGIGEDAHSLQKHVRDRAVQRLTQALITLAVRRRASDLHVEPLEDCLLIRQRIDGIMTEMFRLPRSLAITTVSSLKVKANMDIAEKRVPQDGSFQARVDNADIDVRAASSPTGLGEKISLRLLDIRSIRLEIGQLGMSEEGQEVFRSIINEPHGLVLVTGPTGSGKTTTIYVALQTISGGEKNIISIEDPVEFRIPGVNQIQVNPVAGLTFASGLRSILRQDPDVIVVGEIRDKETAEIAVNAASTGHLVFSTLHTIDSASTVARLIDLGVGARQFADALSLVIAQRLIRLVCQQCKEPYVPPDTLLAQTGLLPDDIENVTFYRGRGCKLCNKTGYHRRSGVFEILEPSQRLRDAIENENLTTAAIRELAIRAGMRTLREEAQRYLLDGRTTAEEASRVIR